MNLAYHYPSVYWSTACLSVNSGSADEDQEKAKSTDYGKIASAIGNLRNTGVEVSLPHINKSKFGFSPDAENNAIIFGLKGINKIGDDLCIDIIHNRSYNSLEDFLSKVKVSKDKVVNLIKSGAFDEIEDKPRKKIMEDYIAEICGKKKRITLQNFQMLSKYNLVPEELCFQKRVFFFNKYLKKFKQGDDYILAPESLEFYQNNFDQNNIKYENETPKICQSKWEKIYQKEMDKVRNFIKSNHDELLNKLNDQIFNEEWNKYATGSLSQWEMDSVSFYFHPHELESVNQNKYSVTEFHLIPEEPIVEKSYKKGDKTINIYKLYRIAGTVLDKNKYRHTVTLLTTSGVVTAKLYKDQFSYFDKQISETDESGKKKVVEKSWFTRGNKILFTGIRKGDVFQPKVYQNSIFRHAIYLITEISNGEIAAEAYRADNPKEERI